MCILVCSQLILLLCLQIANTLEEFKTTSVRDIESDGSSAQTLRLELVGEAIGSGRFSVPLTKVNNVTFEVRYLFA